MSSAKVQPRLLLLFIIIIYYYYLFFHFFFNTALQKHINVHWKFLKCYGSLYI